MNTIITYIKGCPPLMAGIRFFLKKAGQLHQLYLKLCWQIFVRLPIHKKKVIFCNFYGGGFGDNPKFIAEEMIRRKLDFEMYWVAPIRKW